MKSGFLHRFNRQLPQQPGAKLRRARSPRPWKLERPRHRAGGNILPSRARTWPTWPMGWGARDKEIGDFSATKSWGDLIKQHTPTCCFFFMGHWDFGVDKNHALEWFLSIPIQGPSTLEEWWSVSRNTIFVPGKLLPKNGWETIPMLLAMYVFNVVSPVGNYPQHSSETVCFFRDLGLGFNTSTNIYLFLDSS